MSETPEKFYITTPIYYVNARPHIGHAYSTIVADVIARRHRLMGEDVFFLTGTDEHGQKIERSAAAAGIPPQQFADQVSETFRSLWKRMGITNDDFIRTTVPRHKQGVQKLFQVLRDKGFIYLDTYTGQYCVSDEAYVEVGPGEPCPDCGRITETISESNYYFQLSVFQKQLIDKIESNELLIKPESRRNEVLSFLCAVPADIATPPAESDDSDMAPVREEVDDTTLLEFADQNNPFGFSALGRPYLKGALKNLSVSRTSFNWGIPVPSDEDHVIYVWLDALINYMTAVGYGSDNPTDKTKFERYWPAELHLVGKEIIRFHSVYWPAFLMAADLPLPKAIVANGWLLFEESKMSKSRGNVVRTETILDAFGSLKPVFSKPERDLFATDVLRYFLLREIPFGQDGSFGFDALVTRYNADLANGYGNLVSRTLKMIEQYLRGRLSPNPRVQPLNKTLLPEWWTSDPYSSVAVFNQENAVNPFTGYVTIRDKHGQVGLSLDAALVVHGGKYFYDHMQKLTIWEFFQVAIDPLLRAIVTSHSPENLQRFLNLILTHIKVVDELLSVSKPWKMSEDDSNREKVLSVAAEYIRILSVALYPILPYATAQVWSQLGLGSIEEAAKNGALKDLKWGGLQPGTKLGPLSPIFPRADKGLIQIMTDMEAANAQAAAPASSPSKSSLILEENPTAADNRAPTDPAAGPRTASLPSEGAGGHVAASAAITTERIGTPPHSEAAASGVFANSAAASATPDTPPIAIDDFVKIDLRVAQIVVAERIPKADKLLRLEVDLGYEKRQILSGIAEWYTPEELIGRRIVVIANLAPRKMRGLESHGMLLAASHGENGKPVLATFGEEIALGSRLR